MPDPTFTLSDLRRLINTAAAKSGRTVEEVLSVCPRTISWSFEDPPSRGYCACDRLMWLLSPEGKPAGACFLDLTDASTVHALVVLLAFALGIDPGPGGRWVAWRPLYASGPVGLRRVGWWLSGDNEAVYYVAAADATGDDDEVVNDTIAAEPDDLAALVAACKLVIGGSDAR